MTSRLLAMETGGGAIYELKNTEGGKTQGLGNTQEIVIQV